MSSSTIPADSLSGQLSKMAHVVAGAILLCAASLKGFQLASDPLADTFFPSRSMAALAVLGETALGFWLLSGLSPRTVRITATIVFIIFFIASVRQLAVGRKSCGCFGAVEVAPFVTASLDLLLVIGLVMTRPPAGVTVSARGAMAIFAVAIAVAIPAWRVMSPVPVADRLEVVPDTVDLGAISRGEFAEATIRITNRSREQVQLDTYEASCPCLSVRFEAQTISPGGSVSGTVALDMAHEPRFTGLLRITVKGYAPDRRLIYQFMLTADVRDLGP
jgi:hypothetical protein